MKHTARIIFTAAFLIMPFVLAGCRMQEAGAGIEPDIRVEYTLNDYLRGADPAMETAMREAGVIK